MFVVLLKFSENKAQASQFMEDHKTWVQQGFDDGVFTLVGSIQSNLGGALIAHGVLLEGLQERVQQDPFVVENIVKAEIIEITPSRVDERLKLFVE